MSQNATFANVADPVGQGFAASLARPGGNMTGFGAFEFSVGGKWVQGLKELAPSARQLGVIVNPETAPYYPNFFPSLRRLLSTSTTIGVPQLARPGAVFEVEAIAVLPPK